jgi:hypothetical protein
MCRTLASRITIVATLVALAVAAPTALAGKGGIKGRAGSGGTSALAVALVDDANGNGSLNWGDTMTLSVSTTATDAPWVEVACYQGGTLVYSAWAGFWAGYPGSQLMPLRSPAWTGGAADCIATLNTSLASLDFHVDA